MRIVAGRTGRVPLVPVVALAALLVGVAAGAVVGPRLAKKPEAPPKAPKAEAPAEPQIVELGEFLVNVRSGAGLHYAQAQVSLALTGLEPPKAAGGHGGEKAAKSPLTAAQTTLARDRVVSVLSAADFQQVRSPAGREHLKTQVGAALRPVLPGCEISEVLFTSFVVQ